MNQPRKLFVGLTLHLTLWLLAGSALLLFAQQPAVEKAAPAPAREQALRRDARELVDLSFALQKEIDKSNENVLSLNILRKAEELERRARELRERARE